MEQLLTSKQTKTIPQLGDLVTGKVINIGKNEVLLDIDGLTTGVVRGIEFYDESGEYSNLKIGAEATATVVDLENEKGQIELSFRSAGHQRAWDRLIKLMDKGEEVTVEGVDANKGGLMIKLGQISGFLPVSQLSPKHYPRVEGGNKNKILEKLRQFVGQKLKVKIIAVEEAEEKLIVSEKATIKEEQKQIISKYKTGDVVEGKISGVVDFGAFVEFDDGLEGLVHISELAWKRIDNPRDVVKTGQQIKAEIIDIDDSKISLSIKKLLLDPWKKAVEKYKIGQVVEGEVLKVNPFGLFVKLDEEIHGLAHVSELSSKPNQRPEDLAKPGDKLKLKIVSIEPNDHRLGLSIRALGQKGQDKKEAGKEDKKNEQKKGEGNDKMDKIKESKKRTKEETKDITSKDKVGAKKDSSGENTKKRAR